MKGIVLWVSLGIFLIKWHHIVGREQSEATDYSGSAIPANSTSGLIEEEKEEDEINATTPTSIKKEQLVISASSNKTIIYINSIQEY